MDDKKGNITLYKGGVPLKPLLDSRPVEYLCRLPADLGAVTKLRNLNGRIVAETESGIPMIVPQRAALV